MSEEKLDRILKVQEEQGKLIGEVHLTLFPRGDTPPLVELEDRLSSLEKWRSYIAGAIGVVMALLGLHTAVNKH